MLPFFAFYSSIYYFLFRVKDLVALKAKFWYSEDINKNLIICSASVKYVFHKLVSSHARGQINRTKNAKFG